MRDASLLNALAIAVFGFVWSLPASALPIDKGFQWTGDAGYTATGTFTYDDSIATVTANGLGATSGLEELEVSFFDPADMLLGSFINVSAGISSYDLLNFQFDTAIMAVAGSFHVGWSNGFDRGSLLFLDVGMNARFFHLFDDDEAPVDGSIEGADVVVFAPASIPEPKTLPLLGLSLAALGWFRRKRG